MSCEEDVLGIGKTLEKMISKETTDHVSAVDMLKTLQDLPMTLNVLQKTRIGMVVNNFRKSSTSEEAVSLSKSLIKSWKKLLPEGSQANTKSNGAKTNESLDKRQESLDLSQDSQALEKSDSVQSSKYSGTSNPVRLKCQELLANALKVDPMPEGAKDLEELSSRIEESIYELFLNTDSKYKNRVRSRVANLKDAKNPALRLNVLTGLIDPSRIASMTAVEMASEDMKELRAKLTKEAIDDHQMSMQTGTHTSLLSCGKCKKSNCTYNQVQTRSADEPMTTFVFCMECGNRWKFC